MHTRNVFPGSMDRVLRNDFNERQATPDKRDIRLSRLAERRGGIVAREDVRAVGLNREAVRLRVANGLMHPLFPGTWAWGHRAITREAWFHAAVLSVPGDARLDGASACQLYGIYKRRIGRIQVVSDRRRPSRGRLIIRHTKRLPPLRHRHGIPVVPVEEALLGLAASPASDRDVRRAIRQAQVDKLTTHARLLWHAEQAKGRPGIARLRQLLGDRPAPTRSDLEDAALDLFRRYGLEAEANARVDGAEADMIVDGVLVELDSEAFHDNGVSAEDDTLKQERWERNGRRVERLTWDDVHVTPVATIRRLARASRATRSSPRRA